MFQHMENALSKSLGLSGTLKSQDTQVELPTTATSVLQSNPPSIQATLQALTQNQYVLVHHAQWWTKWENTAMKKCI